MAIKRVSIIEVKDTRVAVLEHRGAPALIGESVRRFIAWRHGAGLPPALSATFNILYDDPIHTAPKDFRLDLCAAIDHDVAPNNAGVVTKVIPGGRCAVLRLISSQPNLGTAGRMLYQDWLPASGENLRDFPLYCQRVSFFPEVPVHEAVTDLFLPLK